MRFISWIDCVVTSEGCKEGGGGKEKKRREIEGTVELKHETRNAS